MEISFEHHRLKFSLRPGETSVKLELYLTDPSDKAGGDLVDDGYLPGKLMLEIATGLGEYAREAMRRDVGKRSAPISSEE